MRKKLFLVTLLTSAISYLFFIFLRNYNSLENIEKRCIVKFQNEIKKGVGKSEEEWGLNIDIANDNYFECMKIP